MQRQEIMDTGRPKPTILIVDDTPANLALLSDALKSDYRMKVALSGEAEDQLKSYRRGIGRASWRERV